MLADGVADLDGLDVRYRHAGRGPPVVLLHGGGFDSADVSWKGTVPALADDFEVYAPDWPGYGRSDPPDGPPSVEYYVEVLGRFLDALDLERVRLVGVSMGAAAALGYVIENPDRVEKLVLADSYGLGDRVPGGRLGALSVRVPLVTEAVRVAMAAFRSVTALVLGRILAPGNLTGTLVDEVHSGVRQPKSAVAWEAFQRNEAGSDGPRTDYTDRLADLAVPTLFVHGDVDPLVPVAWAERGAELVPDAELEVLADCGHWPPREKPSEFVAALREFL